MLEKLENAELRILSLLCFAPRTDSKIRVLPTTHALHISHLPTVLLPTVRVLPFPHKSIGLPYRRSECTPRHEAALCEAAAGSSSRRPARGRAPRAPGRQRSPPDRGHRCRFAGDPRAGSALLASAGRSPRGRLRGARRAQPALGSDRPRARRRGERRRAAPTPPREEERHADSGPCTTSLLGTSAVREAG